MTDDAVEWWARYGHLRGTLGLSVFRPQRFGYLVFVYGLVLLLALYPLDWLWPSRRFRRPAGSKARG